MVVALSSSPSFLRSISDLNIHPSSPTTTTKFSFINSPPTSPTSVRFRSQPISASYTSTSETSSSRSPPNFGSPYQLPSSTSSSSSSLYEVLGISMGASSDEIKSAYRKLARVCHPDVVAIQKKDTSADEFMKIHAAYTTLSDPEKRADYDRKLFRRQRSYSSPASSPSSMKSPPMSGYTRRNWETDQCW